jgi:hypothetical protein
VCFDDITGWQRYGLEAQDRDNVTSSGQVEVGQHYRTAATGSASPTVWQVVGIYFPWPGGFQHARLKSVDDRAETMTLAVSVVADKTRFVRIQ